MKTIKRGRSRECQATLPGMGSDAAESGAKSSEALKGVELTASENHAASETGSGTIITKLAELPGEALLDEEALADTLGVTKRTIRRMVGRYELPPPVSFAGRSMWQVGRVLSWFDTRAERLAREAERGAQRLRHLP